MVYQLIITSITNDYVINVPSQTGKIFSIRDSVERVSGISPDFQEYYYSGKKLKDCQSYDTRIMDLANPLQLANGPCERFSSEEIEMWNYLESSRNRLDTPHSSDLELYTNHTVLDWKIQTLMNVASKMLDVEDVLVFVGSLCIPREHYNSKTFRDIEVDINQKLRIEAKRSGGYSLDIKPAGISNTVSIKDFNSLTTQVDFEVVSSGPSWKTVNEGLSFYGICKNSDCDAYGQRVYDCKGTGTFDLGRIINDNHCPECKKPIEASNCGFYQTKWEFDGITSTGEHKPKDENNGCTSDPKKYRTFKAGDNIQWSSLRIGAYSLKNNI